MARAVLEARGIAERVKVNLITPRQVRILRQLLQKANRGENTRGLVAMDPGKNADAEVIAAATRSDKEILLERIVIRPDAPGPQGCGEPGGLRLLQRGQRLTKILSACFFHGRMARRS